MTSTTRRLAGAGAALAVATLLGGCAEEAEESAPVPEACEESLTQDGAGPETGLTCPEGL